MVEIKHFFRSPFNHSQSKLTVDNRLKDLWKRENPVSSGLTRYERLSGTISRITRVYTDINISSNTKIIHIMISSTDQFNSIFIDRFPLKTNIG